MSAMTSPSLIFQCFYSREEEEVGSLLLFAFRTFQPAGSLVPHDMGDLTSHVELSNAITIWIGPLFIERIGGRRLGGSETQVTRCA